MRSVVLKLETYRPQIQVPVEWSNENCSMTNVGSGSGLSFGYAPKILKTHFDLCDYKSKRIM